MSSGRRGFVKPIAKYLGLGLLGLALISFGVCLGSGRIRIGRAPINQNIPNNLNYSSVNEVYHALKQDFDGQLDTSKLLDGLKQGLAAASGDNYTEYLNTNDAKAFNDTLNGSFSGIGAELGKDKNAIVIIAPIAGYPAEKAGLKPKDIITQIDGQNALNLRVSEAVDKIRGAVGTSVKLKVVRGETQELEFAIVRENITIPSVESSILPGNIGYLKVTRFADDTAELARVAAEKFKTASVKGIILDVRNDPGGLLDAAVDVTSLWLPEGKTVLTERRGGNTIIKTYYTQGSSPLAGIPTVVLINEGSASASEITAGALKDNGIATLLGSKSFGKGSVQQLQPLSDGGVLKVTIARWYTPGGRNIDKEGIEPDQKVDRTDDDYKAGRDPQKDAATHFLNK